MGILKNLRDFFKGSNNTPVVHEEDRYKKSMLATQIVNLVGEIKKIDCFDRSIWNLNDISSIRLERKSLTELEKLHSTLSARLSELTKQSQIINLKMQALEDSKWSGQKPKHLTDYEFDRLQRDESR